jgi:hypothetical protein
MWDLWQAKWHWERVFSEFFDFPCQHHSTVALHSHACRGWAVGLMMAAVKRHRLTPIDMNKLTFALKSKTTKALDSAIRCASHCQPKPRTLHSTHQSSVSIYKPSELGGFWFSRAIWASLGAGQWPSLLSTGVPATFCGPCALASPRFSHCWPWSAQTVRLEALMLLSPTKKSEPLTSRSARLPSSKSHNANTTAWWQHVTGLNSTQHFWGPRALTPRILVVVSHPRADWLSNQRPKQ